METHDENPFLARGVHYEAVRRSQRYFVLNRDTGYMYGGPAGWSKLDDVNRAVQVWDDDHRKRMAQMSGPADV